MTMNVFRLSGDMLHVLAVCMVLHRLLSKKNAQGLSRKTQELLLMVWLLRYLDLLTTFYSMYNHFMKFFYIASTVLILVVMRHDPVRSTYSADQDSMKHWLHLFAPTALIGSSIHFFSNHIEDFDLMIMCWTISILLEPVALIPQACMYRKYRRVQSLSGGSFLFMSGMYRFLYLLNWVYRAHSEPHYRHHYFLYPCGVLQAAVGIGGACCCVGNRDSAPLGPQLVHFYKSFKVGWVVTVIFLLGIASAADIQRDMSRTREENQMTIVALLILFVVAVLCLVCYCGFSTYKEETTELSAPLLEAGATEAPTANTIAEGGEEENETKPKRIIKKGIFIHGIQVV